MWYKLKRILIYPDGVTEKQVYPAWWTPGENTLFYYNIDDNDTNSTLYDKIGNFNLTWNVAPTYYTNASLGRYVWMWNLWNNAYATASSYVLFWNEFTMNCLVNYWYNWWGVLYVQWFRSASVSKSIEFDTNNIYFRTKLNEWLAAGSNPWFNKRSLYTFVCSSSWNYKKIYVDGVEVKSSTYNNDTEWVWWYWTLGCWSSWNWNFNWYMKIFMWESKARTAQEISDYYNQIKSNYWL